MDSSLDIDVSQVTFVDAQPMAMLISAAARLAGHRSTMLRNPLPFVGAVLERSDGRAR